MLHTSHVQCFILRFMLYMPWSIYYIPRSTFNIPLFVWNISRPTYSIFTWHILYLIFYIHMWHIPCPTFYIPHYTFPTVLSHILSPTSRSIFDDPRLTFYISYFISHILYSTMELSFHILYVHNLILMFHISYPISHISHFVVFPIRIRKRNKKMPAEHRIQAITVP